MRRFPEMMCPGCARMHLPVEPRFECDFCGRLLSIPLVPYSKAPDPTVHGIWRYARCLPLENGFSLGEGCSPMVEAASRSLAPRSGRLLLKIETMNPSGSFKDRGSALVVSAASIAGYSRIAVASTGNAAASTAAYASRCGLRLTVLVPSWCEMGKMWQITSRGGQITRVAGDFPEAEARYRSLVRRGWYPAGSDNPLRTEGTKTLAYEIFEQAAGSVVDRVIVPVGTGSLLAGIRKGFAEIVAAGALARLPRIDGVQIATVAPLPLQLAGVLYDSAPSQATGINIPRALMAREAIEAIECSGGRLDAVSDLEVLAAQKELALGEGIGAEPTGAVAVAAYRKALACKEIDPRETVVAVITGSLKSGII